MYFLSPLARYFLCLFFTLSVFPSTAGELLKEDLDKIFADNAAGHAAVSLVYQKP
jgi:hypothetical protein